jgi:preprotein translocase subunit SecG
METLVVIVHVLAALGITGLVLIQHGKGADMGASFGSGASQTVFGSVGSGNALTKSTTWLATIFFITSLVLALFAKQQAGQNIQDSLLIENPEQFNTEVQQESDVPVAADPAASDVPALPTTESQTGDVPDVAPDVAPDVSEAQDVPQSGEEAGTEPAAATDPAVQEQVEDTAEDLQNATQN